MVLFAVFLFGFSNAVFADNHDGCGLRVNDYDRCWSIDGELNGEFPFASGTAYIYSATGDETEPIRKPLVFVEGIDFGERLSGPEIHDMLNNPIPDGPPVSIASIFKAQGYDIVILNFESSTTWIESNSEVLQSLLNQLNNEKEGDEEIVIIAASMGGLVARHALVEMEPHGTFNSDHNVRLLITIDTPHLGAHVPLGVQYFIKYFSGESDGANVALNDVLYAPATRQMLIHHESSNRGEVGNRLRDFNQHDHFDFSSRLPEFISFFDNLDYPNRARIVAIANGNGFGEGQVDQLPDDANLLHFSYNSLGFDALGQVWTSDFEGQIFHGKLDWLDFWGNDAHNYRVSVTNTLPLDLAPGGWRNTMTQVARLDPGVETILDEIIPFYGSDSDITAPQCCHAFIPTYSALGISTSNPSFSIHDLENVYDQTVFDQIYYPGILDSSNPTSNQQHVQFTPENGQWIICEVFYDFFDSTVYNAHGCQGTGIAQIGQSLGRAEPKPPFGGESNEVQTKEAEHGPLAALLEILDYRYQTVMIIFGLPLFAAATAFRTNVIVSTSERVLSTSFLVIGAITAAVGFPEVSLAGLILFHIGIGTLFYSKLNRNSYK